MDTNEARSTSRSLSVLNGLLGVWLIVSPYLLGYAVPLARWEQTIAGAVIAVMAGVRYLMPQLTWASVVIALAGLWMIIAPFATGYRTMSAIWNAIIFGALVTLVAIWNLSLAPSSTRHHD